MQEELNTSSTVNGYCNELARAAVAHYRQSLQCVRLYTKTTRDSALLVLVCFISSETLLAQDSQVVNGQAAAVSAPVATPTQKISTPASVLKGPSAAAFTPQSLSASGITCLTFNGNGASRTTRHSISANGRYVAIESQASNLVASDTNAVSDIFVLDRQTNSVVRASIDSNGIQANGASGYPGISADGTKVVFESSASNLVADDTNNTRDVFLRDLTAGTTTRLSVSSTGTQSLGGGGGITDYPMISANGTKVVFQSSATNLVSDDTNGAVDIFVRDVSAGTTSRVSLGALGEQGNGESVQPDISADATKVVFSSAATNLVPNDTNGSSDVFIRNLASSNIVLASLHTSGVQGNGNSEFPSLSSDSTKVVFHSLASNLAAPDTNATYDVFLRDITASSTSLVSIDYSGTSGSSDLSVDGSISADGTRIAFHSYSSSIVANDTNGVQDVFVRDIIAGNTIRVSVNSSGVQGNSGSFFQSLSAGGSALVFTSSATNLIAGGNGLLLDVFAVDLMNVAGATDWHLLE